MSLKDISCVIFSPDGTSHPATSYEDVQKALKGSEQGFAKLEAEGRSVGFVHIGGPQNGAGPPQPIRRRSVVDDDRKSALYQQWEGWMLASNPELILEGFCRLLQDTYGISRTEAEQKVLDAFKSGRKGGNNGL